MSDAFRTTAGVFSDDWLYSIRVVGPDRARFLNGMLSNDVSKLREGQGCWAVKATHKGRIEGLVRVRARADDIVLDVAEPAAERVAGQLNDYIVADDCELEDETPERAVIFAYGITAETLVGRLVDQEAGLLTDCDHARYGDVTVVADRRFEVPGFELHVPIAQADAWRARVADAGLIPVTRADFEVLRVESKVPADGPELNLETFPMEARLEHAIDYRKGCYIGQEVITRATTQGSVRHRLVGLDLGKDADAAPPAGAKLWPEGEAKKPAGEITSAVWSPHYGRALGLGFVRTEHEASGTRLVARVEGREDVGVLVR
jgi:folate-binding protein YgfZ